MSELDKKQTQKDARRTEADIVSAWYMCKKSASGYRKADLARDMGVSPGLVTQWLSGDTRIPDSAMMRLGVILGFDPFGARPGLEEYLSLARELGAVSDVLLSGLTADELEQVSSFAEFLRASRKQ